MISVYNIKPRFQKMLTPILRFLYQRGITANQITVSSVFLSLIIGSLFWYADLNSFFYLALPVGLFIRMALNALDGMMARTYNQQTSKGEVLNEMGDLISDLFIFFPLMKYEQHVIYLVVLFICLSIINEFAGILGKVIKGERRYEGPMGKSDRALIIGLYGLLSFLSFKIHEWIVYLLILLIGLLVISTLTRIRKTLN